MSMVAAGIMAGGAIISGIFGASAASKREAAANRRRAAAQKKLTHLENNRQAVINPYDGASDLSSMIKNPYEQLGVATKAAEMQIEEADIALANTLDAIRSTGAGAGGATALAQAALKSKKGVTASIEQQEAQNEKLRAQGEAESQKIKMAEKIRMQGLDAAGKQFVFNTQENRDMAKMDRLSAQISGAEASASQASADVTGAVTGAFGTAVAAVGAGYSHQQTLKAMK